MGEAEDTACERAFEINLHGLIGDVVDSVIAEFSFGFDETEEDNMENESTETDSTGASLHYVFKCDDISKPADKLYENVRTSESQDSAFEDEDEELISSIVLDGFELDQKQTRHVEFSDINSTEQENKLGEGRAKSHHIGLSRTGSMRNMFNRVFHRSKSSTQGPFLDNEEQDKEPTKPEKAKPAKKKRRFFKRAQPKQEESRSTSIEVQHEGTDITTQTQQKLISGLFSRRKSKNKPETDNENPLDGARPSRIGLGGVRNSLMSLFFNRPVVV